MQRKGTMREMVTTALKPIVILSFLIQPSLGASTSDPPNGEEILVIVKGVATPFSEFGLLKHLHAIPGVEQVNFNLMRGLAKVRLKPGAQVTDDEIIQTIRSASYTPGSITRAPMPSALTKRAAIENGHPGSQP